jgi:hypothetical protein
MVVRDIGLLNPFSHAFNSRLPVYIQLFSISIVLAGWVYYMCDGQLLMTLLCRKMYVVQLILNDLITNFDTNNLAKHMP